MADIRITNEGSVFAFEFLTEAAKAWQQENVQAEGWQWLGRRLAVDARYAEQLAEGACAAGLEVE